jgi:formylglycine-generating enzyme required for sulfatase activity
VQTRPASQPVRPSPETPTPVVPENPGPSAAQLALKAETGRLLTLAEQDLAANRLTSPAGNNAFERYQAVLDMEKDNARAKQGLASIVSKYIALSDAALGKEAFAKAEGYLAKASEVIPDAMVIVAARSRLASARQTKAEAARRAEFDRQMAAGRKALDGVDKPKAVSAFESALSLYPDDAAARAGMKKARALPDGPRHGDKYANSLGMKFVYIGPGSFMMGSPPSESGQDSDEKLHRVTLTKGYWLQTTEVTQGQWQAVMGRNPSRFSSCGSDCSVEKVSWTDAQDFIRKLNRRGDKITYALPTEAQWEYGARAGTSTPFAFGNCLSTSQANYDGNRPLSGCSKGTYRRSTVKVASFSANAWGLYDMHGNVWEWCQDWWGDYPSGSVTDPTGPSAGSGRVVRGGGWGGYARDCRSAGRDGGSPGLRNNGLGLRLAGH